MLLLLDFGAWSTSDRDPSAKTAFIARCLEFKTTKNMFLRRLVLGRTVPSYGTFWVTLCSNINQKQVFVLKAMQADNDEISCIFKFQQ